MESNMNQEMTHAVGHETDNNTHTQTVIQKKKKVSWLHTMLWMLSMVLLANIVMGIVAYFLFFRK